MPKILSAATSVPEHRYGQDEIRETCRALFGPLFVRAGRAGIFDHAGVATRHFVEPTSYYLQPRTFEQKNKDYFKHARRLSETAIREALAKAGLDFKDVDHVVSVTTTGLMTPSLEAHLAQELPFRPDLKRSPLFGAGCAGGAVSLARAADYLEGHPKETVLVLSVELCSLTFLPQERTMTQLVAAALFGDGASAAVLAGDKHPAKAGVRVLDSRSLLLPDSLDVMGWDFSDAGMKLILSPRAPDLIERHFREAAESFLERSRLTLADMGAYLLHPGSGKILDAAERALGIGAEQTRASRAFLSRYGNLSSSCLLFILRDALEEDHEPGSYGLMAAFGPGFACELLLLQFP